MRVSVDYLASLPETVNSIFKVFEYHRVQNNDFALVGHGIHCIPVLVARLRERSTFYF